MKYLKSNWHKAALLMIMALAGFLSFYAVGQEGYANQYYSAAVRSMLTSWHNFFFASFDPGGYVTVDKPALGLWLQAASALIFGFHGWSLILPEALSTVVSVALIYHLVQRFFGKAAGIISALVLALTPILIAVSRTNNLDASLVMVLLFAAWAMVVAAERGSFKLLLLSVVLVGLGFNIKMLEAFMVLPALYLVYLFTSPLKIKKRILQLTVATAVLLAVSLSWAVIVDLTPAGSRPYIGSSQTNSVIELALGYNGIQRITGNSSNRGIGRQNGEFPNIGADNAAGFPGNGIQSSNGQNQALPNGMTPPDNNTQNTNGQAGSQSAGVQGQTDGNSQGNGGMNGMQAPPNDGSFQGGGELPSFGNMPGGFNRDFRGQGMAGGNGGPGGTGENGQKGIFRIFNQQLAGQISWFLPMALFGILALYFRTKSERAENRKSILRQLILWSAWIAPMIAYFSVAGFFHRYYLSMLAPGIAALSGIGIVEMWKTYLESGWKWILLPAALVSTTAVQVAILSNYTEWRSLLIVVCALCLLSAAALIIIRLLKKDNLRKTIKVTLAAGVAALLIAPAVWSYTPIVYGSQTTLPVAGPELKRGGDVFGMNNMPDIDNLAKNTKNTSNERAASSQLIQFLLSKQKGEKYLVAVADANSAAPIILETGKAVMAVGGFSGSDNILTVEKLSQMVANGEIRYFQLSGRGMGQSSEISAWVQAHGKVVTLDDTGTSSSSTVNENSQGGFAQSFDRMGGEGTLYDLAPEKDTK